MPDVFISYSRKDKAFVQKLHAALVAEKRDVWIDWEGIPLSADWWAEIATGIEGSDAFVFVISPDSIVSEVCARELGHAETHNKRLVPILYRDVKAQELPPRIASLNWIFFRESDNFEQASRALIETLNTDLEWVKAHTRLTERAVEWAARGRNDSYLLRGDDLADAEWRLTQMHQEPALTELQGEYILASRRNATRRQRLIIGAVTVGLIVSIILGLVAFSNFLRAEEQYRQAEIARQTAVAAQQTAQFNEQLAWQAVATAEAERNRAATAEALAYVLLAQAEAERALAHSRELAADALINLDQDPELSVLLALQGLAITHTLQAEEALHLALQAAGVTPTFGQADNLLAVNYTPASGSGSQINDLAFSPDGRYLAAAGDDNSFRIWQLESGELLHTIQGHEDRITGLAFSPDGQRLVTSSLDSTGKVWEVASGWEVMALSEGGYTAWINSAAFSPDGRWIALAGNDGVVKLWDAASGERGAVLGGHTGPVRSVAFSPDSSRLASAGLDGDLRLWNVAGGESWQTLATGHNQGILSVAFSPDGNYLATAGGDGQVKVWETATGKALQSLSGHQGEVREVAFSPRGDRLGSLSAGGQIKLWSLNNSGEALTLPGHTADLQALAFSPDGRHLVAAGADGNLRLYLLDPEALQTLARSQVARTLTQAECRKYLHMEVCPG